MPLHLGPEPIVVATGNPHKVEEFAAILGARGLRFIGLRDLPDHDHFTEPAETGTTFEANARIKAISYAKQTGRICLADDSGIEIDALRLPDGTPRPGVISSHYASDGDERGLSRAERDAANNARVLRELDGLPLNQRTARFVCVICIADPSGAILAETRGHFEGAIGVPPRVPAGNNGFGYDPLFLVGPDFARTGAELSSDEKNGRSHRAMAARELIMCMA